MQLTTDPAGPFCPCSPLVPGGPLGPGGTLGPGEPLEPGVPALSGRTCFFLFFCFSSKKGRKEATQRNEFLSYRPVQVKKACIAFKLNEKNVYHFLI